MRITLCNDHLRLTFFFRSDIKIEHPHEVTFALLWNSQSNLETSKSAHFQKEVKLPSEAELNSVSNTHRDFYTDVTCISDANRDLCFLDRIHECHTAKSTVTSHCRIRNTNNSTQKQTRKKWINLNELNREVISMTSNVP